MIKFDTLFGGYVQIPIDTVSYLTFNFIDQFQEQCGQRPKIAALYDKLQTCNDRVNSRTKTDESCAEELFDYMDALNNCVGETLFSKLK